MRIEDIVKEVLEYTPYVALAGIGSFTVRQVSASIDMESGELSAPRLVYSFVRERQFDDGALVQHLRRYRDTEESEAIAVVSKWVNDVKLRLDAGEKVRFTGIGQITREGYEVVYTADALPSDSVLRTPIYTIPRLQNRPRKNGREGNLRPWILVAGGMILLTVLGLGGYYYYVKTSRNIPSPGPTVEQRSIPPLPLDEDKAKTGETIDSTHAQQVALRVTPAVSNPTSTTKKTQSNQQETQRGTTQRYFVVIAGSFRNLERATKIKEAREEEGYQVRIITHKNMYRVIIGTFPTYADAIRLKTTYCTKMDDPNAAYVPKQAISVEN